MKKISKTKSSKSARVLIIILGVVAALTIVLFFARGWLRMTVAPFAVETIYGNSAQEVYEAEANKLQDPLALLGYQEAQPTLNNRACYTQLAQGIKTQISCSYNYDLLQEIPTSGPAKQKLLTNAERLQKLLQANGWEGEYANNADYTSLVRLTMSLTSGIDYQPDATYFKNIGDVECMFSNTTAFSSPDTPKMNTRLYCSRTFNLFGEPSWN